MPYDVRKVMTDTQNLYRNNPILINAVKCSIENQYMVSEQDQIIVPPSNSNVTNYVVSGKRTFEAAKGYSGKKVAVLNFASNHNIGGKPFSSVTQEESLCHRSTLYPCLQAMWVQFYQRHENDFKAGRLTDIGNDDLIYTPNVVVFKTDDGTNEPEMMPETDWYQVNVISCAAPRLRNYRSLPRNYEQIIRQRIKKILDVAAREGNEVLILGAWGCGYYRNPPEVIASVFCSLLPNYSFETVEFALPTKGDIRKSVFYEKVEALKSSSSETPSLDGLIKILDVKSFASIFGVDLSPEEAAEIDNETNKYINSKERFNSLLESIGRPETEQLLLELERNSFYRAPASMEGHDNCVHGLLYHSLNVYNTAMKLRDEMLQKDPGLAPELDKNSVAVAALLHDVCKADSYAFDQETKKVIRIQPSFPLGGHGDKSVIKILMWGYPLTPEEVLAIKWHMGEKRLLDDEDVLNFKKAKEHPLCSLLIMADYEASKPSDDEMILPAKSFAKASPNKISKLKENQIFVFGSNLAGHHSAGAARQAMDVFGAIWGQGVGLQGKSYAIPTMQGPVSTIKPYVDDFLAFASQHPELEFLVTRIGCGIAGFKDRDIAPLFADAINHPKVRLPQSFIEFLQANKRP